MNLPVITLMFDDGFSEVYHDALPMLEDFGYTANVAVSGSKINGDGYLTIEQVKELLSKGWGLSDHSYSHANFRKMDVGAVEREISDNRKFVKDLFCYELNDFVFPKSKLSPSSLSLVLSYYPTVFTGTTEITGNTLPFRHRLLKRVEISTYETFLYGLRFLSFTRKLQSYLKTLASERRVEWLILFTHKVTDRPGLFDASKKQFGIVLNAIAAADVPVLTTGEVMRVFNEC